MRDKGPVTQIEQPFPRGKTIVSKTDLDGRITEVNDAFIELCGYASEEPRTRTVPGSWSNLGWNDPNDRFEPASRATPISLWVVHDRWEAGVGRQLRR
jgi:PAS domain-containing protein